jgi:hypothetical protein
MGKMATLDGAIRHQSLGFASGLNSSPSLFIKRAAEPLSKTRLELSASYFPAHMNGLPTVFNSGSLCNYASKTFVRSVRTVTPEFDWITAQ